MERTAENTTGKGLRILVRDRMTQLFLRQDDAWSSAMDEARIFDSFCAAFAYCLKLRITGTEAVIEAGDDWVVASFT